MPSRAPPSALGESANDLLAAIVGYLVWTAIEQRVSLPATFVQMVDGRGPYDLCSTVYPNRPPFDRRSNHPGPR